MRNTRVSESNEPRGVSRAHARAVVNFADMTSGRILTAEQVAEIRRLVAEMQRRRADARWRARRVREPWIDVYLRVATTRVTP